MLTEIQGQKLCQIAKILSELLHSSHALQCVAAYFCIYAIKIKQK